MEPYEIVHLLANPFGNVPLGGAEKLDAPHIVKGKLGEDHPHASEGIGQIEGIKIEDRGRGFYRIGPLLFRCGTGRLDGCEFLDLTGEIRLVRLVGLNAANLPAQALDLRPEGVHHGRSIGVLGVEDDQAGQAEVLDGIRGHGPGLPLV